MLALLPKFLIVISNPTKIFELEEDILSDNSSEVNLGSIALQIAPILFKAYNIYTISGVVAIATVTISPFLTPHVLKDLATASILSNNSLYVIFFPK